MSGYDYPQKPGQEPAAGYQQGYQQQAYDPQPGYQQVGYQQPGVYQQQGYQASPPYQDPAYQQQPAGYGGTAPTPGGYGAAGSGYQPYQPAVLVGVPMYPDSSDEQLKAKFISQGYKDVPFAIVFGLQLLATVIWGFVNVGRYKDDFKGDDYSVRGNFQNKLAKYLTGAAFTSLALVALMLALMRLMPRLFIVLANIIVVIVNVCAAIYGFAKVDAWAGVMFAILGALHLLWLYFVRRRIPLAGALLANSVSVITKHYGAIVVSFGSLLALTLHVVFFCLMVIPTMQDIDNDNYADGPNGSDNSSGGTTITFGQFLLVCMFLLMFYWTTQVICNVVHVTASGTVATWYFAGANSMPPNPSVASLKRALTTSFGSICFGSLVVALLKLMHALCRSAAHHRRNFLSIIALCLISCLERLMEYFNVYAFTHVAIYGSGFIDAAKQTWEMIKNCGITAIINDNLVFPVLNLTTLIDSLAIGVGFGFAAHSFLIGLLCFLISAVIHIIVFRVVYSGIVTLFVCYAENPQIVAMSNPQFNTELQEGLEALKQPVC